MAPANLGNDPFLTHTTPQQQPQRQQKTYSTASTKARESKYQHAHRQYARHNICDDWWKGILLVVLPLLVFLLITCLWLYVHYALPLATWLAIFCCFLCSGGLIAIALYGTKDLGWAFVLGVSCSVACLLALWFGSVGYQWYMREFWWMEIGRHYTDLNATTSAMSRSDASWLYFRNESKVDTMKAVGYRDGAVFCVAPVLSANQVTRVEYWAIGKDCCQKRSGFTCGEAGHIGAHSAIAMRGQDFVDKASYLRAVRQAEASYKLASAEGALLVRWVSNPKSIRDGLLWSGLWILLLGALMELIIASILACAIPRPHGQMGFQKNPYGTKAYGTKDPEYW